MPAKNAIKTYAENSYYHVYNRGLNKANIYDNGRDYKTFLFYLKRYLTLPPANEVRPRWRSDLCEQVSLIAYCLMPNHFHLLIKQDKKYNMTCFMRCLTNAYTKYFNNTHHRSGPLFQGKYKAVLTDNDNYLLHLSRYIHQNPKEILSKNQTLLSYPFSSYAEYLGKRNTAWIKPDEVLAFFKKTSFTSSSKKEKNTYQNFVDQMDDISVEILKNLTLDLEYY